MDLGLSTSPVRINIAFLARRYNKYVPRAFVFPFFDIVFVDKALHQLLDRCRLQAELTLYVGQRQYGFALHPVQNFSVVRCTELDTLAIVLPAIFSALCHE